MPFTIWRNFKKLTNTLGNNPPPAEKATPAPKKKPEPVRPSPPSLEGTMSPQEYAARKAALDAFAASREAPSSRATRLEEKKKKIKAMQGP